MFLYAVSKYLFFLQYSNDGTGKSCTTWPLVIHHPPPDDIVRPRQPD